MEGFWSAAPVDPLHFCHRRKPDWFCGEKDHECVIHPAGLALGGSIYNINNTDLAAGRSDHQYSFWAVPVF